MADVSQYDTGHIPSEAARRPALSKEAARQPGARMAGFAVLYQLLLGAIVLVLVAGDVISFIISMSAWKPLSLLSGMRHSRCRASAMRCETMKSNRS